MLPLRSSCRSRSCVTGSRICGPLSVASLMPGRTYDEKKAHPLTREVERRAKATPWVAQAVGRVRDEGHVFHVEMFVVPKRGENPSIEQFTQLREALCELDWKIHDVAVVPVAEIPRRQAPR